MHSVCAQISAQSGADPKTIGNYWWREFSALCTTSNGTSFRTQRALEQDSLATTITHFDVDLDPEALSQSFFEFWSAPPIFSDAMAFLREIEIPVCIVSNIDNDDLVSAMAHHKISVDHVVTSEDARSYKPRPECFTMALQRLDMRPDDVLHVGDSLTNDVAGAGALGIPCAWMNRRHRPRPSEFAAAEAFSFADISTILRSRVHFRAP